MITTRQKIHGGVAALLMFALLGGGWVLGGAVSQSPTAAVTLPGRTIIHTQTRVLTKVVKGRVVRLRGGQRVVRIPVVVIRNLACHPDRRHHCVRIVVVPAHTIPLRQATVHRVVAVAAVSVPVTVFVTVPGPTTTVTSPPVTITLPVVTTTETSISTETVTVPLVP